MSFIDLPKMSFQNKRGGCKNAWLCCFSWKITASPNKNLLFKNPVCLSLEQEIYYQNVFHYFEWLESDVISSIINITLSWNNFNPSKTPDQFREYPRCSFPPQLPSVFHFKATVTILGKIQWRGYQVEPCHPEPSKNQHQRAYCASINSDSCWNNVNSVFHYFFKLISKKNAIWFNLWQLKLCQSLQTER